MDDLKTIEVYFTVGELNKILSTLPPNLPVFVSGYKNGYENFFHPEVVSVRHEPDNWFEDGEFQITREEGENIFDALVLTRVNRDD